LGSHVYLDYDNTALTGGPTCEEWLTVVDGVTEGQHELALTNAWFAVENDDAALRDDWFD
jgi:hypothetical protein